MTQALDRQIAVAADQMTVILRELSPEHHVTAFIHALELRGDVTGDTLEDLGNQVGRMGHELNALAAPVTPLEPVALIEDHGPIVMAAE